MDPENTTEQQPTTTWFAADATETKVDAPAAEVTEEQTPPEAVEQTPEEPKAQEPAKVEETKEESAPAWLKSRLEREKAKAQREAAAEVEYWKQQAMRAGGAQPQAEATPASAADQRPQQADYPDTESYVEAHTAWAVRQEMSVFQRKQQEQAALSSYANRVKEYTKANPTFETDVQEFIDLYADQQMPELTQLAFESDVGPALVHYLSKNGGEMERILAMPSHRRLIALGKLEDKLSAPPAAPSKKSNAPAPVTPEKGVTPTQKSLNDPNLSQAEYRALRMASLKNRRH